MLSSDLHAVHRRERRRLSDVRRQHGNYYLRLSSGYVTEWMTADGGTTFGVKRRNTAYTLNTVQGMNQLGSPGNTDAYYVTSRNSTQLQLDINRGTARGLRRSPHPLRV